MCRNGSFPQLESSIIHDRDLSKNYDTELSYLHLRAGESIPHVVYNQQNHRAHRFPDARPYLFQLQPPSFNGNECDGLSPFPLSWSDFPNRRWENADAQSTYASTCLCHAYPPGPTS